MPRIREYRWERWARWAAQKILEDMPEAIAVDTETTGLGWHDQAFCATLTWRTPEGNLRSAYVELDENDARPLAGAGVKGVESAENQIALLKLILTHVPTWVFWNAKFDLERLAYIGALPDIEGHTIEDGQPIASIINENRRMALKVRAVEDLGHVDTVQVEIKSGPNKGKKKAVAKEEHQLAAVRRKLKLKKEDGYHLLPRENIIPYAITDTELTLRWWEKHRPLIADYEDVYQEEIDVIHALWGMESNGVGVDVPYLEEQEEIWGAKVMHWWTILVGLTGKEDFNPGSPDQIKAAFAAVGVSLESTDKAHLRDLLASSSTPEKAVALVEALHEYREAAKIHGTYLTSLLAIQRDGIAHPWFNSVGPRTGRMSSSKAVA